MKNDPEHHLRELQQKLQRGQISRRDFLRSAALLGLSVGVGEILASCQPQPKPSIPSGFEDFEAALGDPEPPPYKAGTPGAGAAAAAGQPAAVPAPEVSPARKQIDWLCAACGEQLPSAEALRTHALEEHGKRLPKIQRVDQPTYSEFLVGKVKRFDEKNTAFSRAVWDEAYQVKVKAAVEKYAAAAAKRTRQQHWDALEGQALVAGAIYVDDSVGVLHPGYGGYMGHMKEVGGLYGWEDPLNETRFPVADPAWMSARIKQVARLYGASLVGITKVNPLWVYSHYFERATGNSGPIDMSYPYAIVIGIEMDWEAINKTPKYEASAATALAYSQMAELSASLAKYIRALGYHALPCGNDTAQSIPLAIDAGLGEIGRNGLLITPEFGPRQRLCKVFTNIPLKPDQPIDFGMRSFCETCHSCASSCPANAIPMGDRSTEPASISNRTGIQRWTVNVTDCLLFWRENGVDCSNCVAACPWALRSTRDWLET